MDPASLGARGDRGCVRGNPSVQCSFIVDQAFVGSIRWEPLHSFVAPFKRKSEAATERYTGQSCSWKCDRSLF
jgi:hypothetical protein